VVLPWERNGKTSSNTVSTSQMTRARRLLAIYGIAWGGRKAETPRIDPHAFQNQQQANASLSDSETNKTRTYYFNRCR